MEQTQYSLELSFDAPLEASSQHSIRTLKKQKIKNLGLLGRKVPTVSSGENAWNARAQQVLERFSNDPTKLFRKLAARLAVHESKAKAGAFDWQSWEEKFFQLLCFRRFIPHPALLANADTMEFPRNWGFVPSSDRSALIPALQELRQARAFAGLRFYTNALETGDSFALFTDFARTLDSYFAKGPKPYPEIEAIVAAHDAKLPAFLSTENLEKRRCRRSVGVVLHENLAQHPLVYEPILRDIHARLQNQDELHVSIYFRALKTPTEPGIWRERPCAGALNLSEFVDSSTGKFLWEELKSALGASLRLIVNWREIAPTGLEPSEQPWIGLTGWADALAKLDLEYSDPRAIGLAARLLELLNLELGEAERRLEGQKELASGSLAFTLRPSHSRFIAQVAGVRAGVLPETAFGQEKELIAMQSAFQGGSQGMFVLPRPERLEVEKFTEILVGAAKAGWLGVRLLSVLVCLMGIFANSGFAQTQARTRSFGTSSVTAPMCRIQVTREGTANSKTRNIGASPRPSVYAVERTSQTQAKVVSSLVVTNGLKASLEVNGESVDVRCHVLRSGYELDVTVASRPPLVYPSQPAPGPVKSLTTTVSLQPGQRLELGGVVRDLRNQGGSTGTSGIDRGTANETSNERVFLMVE